MILAELVWPQDRYAIAVVSLVRKTVIYVTPVYQRETQSSQGAKTNPMAEPSKIGESHVYAIAVVSFVRKTVIYVTPVYHSTQSSQGESPE